MAKGEGQDGDLKELEDDAATLPAPDRDDEAEGSDSDVHHKTLWRTREERRGPC